MSVRALLLGCLALGGCRKPPVRALLDDAGGLTVGSRVYAAGLGVGAVDQVRLVDDRAEVQIALSSGHTLAPRADACALVLDADGGPLLLVFPGKRLEPLEGPLRACEASVRRAELERLAESAHALLSSGARRALASLTPPPLPADAGPCASLSVSRLRVEPVEPVALLLPEGGRRLWLAVENRARAPIALEAATFLDGRGTVAPPARLPDSSDLLLSVSIPAGARREVSAVFEGQRAGQITAVEVEAAFADAPLEACRARWRL